MRFLRSGWLGALLSIGACGGPALAAVPPVPVPPENPLTEEKRVLGKILFWDEQLSSDDTVACGTCHRPAQGGADPRAGRHPGVDKGTIDDVRGSPGIVSLDRDGRPTRHALFGDQPQVTPRLAPSNFAALWAEELFWDGRAGSEFKDPLTGKIAIARGGALENQALESLANEAEMAKQDRTWPELRDKLARAQPLALATDLPKDVAAALAARPTYPELFAAAFGDPAATPVAIAFAIASYQRTLVSDATAWDRYDAGDATAIAGRALYGWRALQAFHCVACHEPPLFTNNEFFQIGLRRAHFDKGREAVTRDPEDAGEMKVPSLRNAALRPRFMHTGELTNLGAAIGFYVTTPALPERDGIPGAGLYTFNMSQIDETDIREFIEQALTDPRVRDETFPFDRPTLRSERVAAAAPH
jgi:cytochrome c peroxidase